MITIRRSVLFLLIIAASCMLYAENECISIKASADLLTSKSMPFVDTRQPALMKRTSQANVRPSLSEQVNDIGKKILASTAYAFLWLFYRRQGFLG